MPTLSGSLNVTGSINTSGSITNNGAPVVTSTQTGSFVTSTQTGSFVTSTQTGSFATTGSSTFNGNVTVTGSMVITGSLTISGSSTLTNIGPFVQIGATQMTGSLNQSGSVKIGYLGSNYSTLQVSKNIFGYDDVYITSGADGLSHEDIIYIQTQPTATSNILGITTQGKIDIYTNKAAFRSNASGGSKVEITGSLDINNGLTASGSATINNILTIVPRTTLPTGMASGSIIVSGSATGIKPYFWNGATWTAMF
jgi:hypothetical protein